MSTLGGAVVQSTAAGKGDGEDWGGNDEVSLINNQPSPVEGHTLSHKPWHLSLNVYGYFLFLVINTLYIISRSEKINVNIIYLQFVT